MDARGAWSGLGPTLRGMAWLSLGGLLFACLNTIMRELTQQLHPWQVQCVRYFFGFVVLWPFMLRAGIMTYRTGNLKLQLARNVFHTISNGLWFLGISLTPVAEVTAISFAAPIFMTIGAMLFLGEVIRWRRWLAIGVGFLGVLLVIWPKFEGGVSGGLGSIYLLVAAPISAGSFLMAKVLTRTDRPEAIVAWQAALVSLFAFPFALPFWMTMSWTHVAVFLACGLLGSAGHYAVMQAYKLADVSAVQPMRFLELIWAAVLGFVFLAERPTLWTFAGGAVIFASTWYIANREAKLERERRRKSAA